MRSNPVSALLEIRRRPNGEIPVSLLSAAYRASRTRPVVLVLDSVSPKEIDCLLDPVVATDGHGHQGVVYTSLNDESRVLSAAENAAKVFAASDDLRTKLASRGIAYQDVSEAEHSLNAG